MTSSRSIRSKALRLAGVAGVVVATSLPGVAFAQDVGTYGNGGDNHTSNTGSPGAVEPGTSGGGSSLPFTGGDVVGLVLIGTGAVVGGTALSRAGRRAARA